MSFNRQVRNLIADLRGLPREQGRGFPREATPVAQILERLRERYRIGEERVEEHIMRHWKQIVGADYAHRCAPECIRSGDTLVIYVSNATLRNELQFDQRRILKRLSTIPGCENIQRLAFRQG